ncbi:alpha-2-macroglobulin family protein [Flavilitoribacter nigricans]|nr:alpha-2-macroglobulin family protein [Flavilitoribacter nigricans]
MPVNNDPYTAEWKAIDSLQEQGLPNSALGKALELYDRAKNDKNAAHQAKAAIQVSALLPELSEDGTVASINYLETEFPNVDFPVDAIFQSVLGELYMNYLRDQIWRIRQRESVSGDPGTDIKTWSAEQLLQKSTEYYLASVEDPEALLAVPIGTFDPLFPATKNTDDLRPTLFDFLAHRAIDQFTNELTYITQPVYQFTIDDPAAFDPAAEFVSHTFVTEDETSFPYLTLSLFQRVLGQHLEDDQPAALVDADLKRLQVVHEKAVLPQKDSLYLHALEAMAERYTSQPVYTEILAQIAEFKLRLGRTYQPGTDDEKRWLIKEAYELCQTAIEKFPDSYGAIKCKNLQQSIRSKQLELKIEQVNIPVQPSLLWIGYTNIDKVFLQVYRLDSELDFSTLNYNERIAYIKRQKPVKTWSQAIPDEGDYQGHSVELAVPVLDIGHYVIVVSDTESIEPKVSRAAFVETHVSQLAYLHRHSPENQMQFVVVNRSSGAPMPGVKAEFFTRMYNRQKQQYELNKVGESVSDADGFVHHNVTQNLYFRVKLTLDQDILFLENGYSNYNSSNEPRNRQMAHFFLDRAIYRPGQTVYFKAILLEKDGETQQPRILPNEKTTVSFHDANGQEVKKLELTSNDYGSISGSFVAPASGLLGQMFLRAGNGSTHYFRVEEYKRPRFEVTFDKLDSQPQLNTEVSVAGTAAGFAGDQVQDANVTYRVVREVRYPWLPWWRRSSMRFPGGRSASMEVANGTTKTDADGNFTISFPAKADPTVNRQLDPAFVFTVYADVTDITGETHSGEKSIQLARLGLQAEVVVPDASDRQKPLELKVNTNNLDGEPQDVTGSLVIERLVAPAHPYLERYWEKPDYHVIDKETFSQQFPLMPYEDENEPQNWPVVGEIYGQEINTGTSQSLKLEVKDWPVGHYRYTFTTQDQGGHEIKAQGFFQLYDRVNQQIPTNEWLWTQLDQKVYEPKDLANLAIASSLENWHLLYEVDRRDKKEEPHWVDLQKWLDMNELVREEDRGSFHIKIAAIRYNRVFTPSVTVVVPWSNKELQIEYQTFRDKLRPGAEEEWQLKISGPGGEKVAAELVAAMYDASLDQFAENNWNFTAFPNYYMDHRRWQGAGFGQTNGNMLNTPQQDWDKLPERTYRRLILTSRVVRLFSARSMAPAPAAPRMETIEEESVEMDMAMAESKVANVAGMPTPYDDATGGDEADADTDQDAPITPRTNLNETVFFLPDLRTDEDGNVLISFTMNEALTRWKFLAFAHTPELAYASSEKEIVTQKELMVLPSAPRFFRESDEIVFAAKVSNLSEGPLSGSARLELFDARTRESIDVAFGNDQANVSFQTEAGGSAGLEWKLEIPTGRTSAVIYRVTARAGSFTDGEEAALPVLTNRMLVTESQPLALNGGESKTFELGALGKALSSPTAKAHQFSLEFTSNPAWYAVQALPYLMEYPYECTEQIFNRYYANALASSAANQYPKVRQVFTEWRDQAQDAMLSNLRKNQDLKALLLEETPWVLDAQNEEEQKQNIGLLFDLDRMSREEESTLAKLDERQQSDGSFSWFPGGNPSWHITQYVVQGIGRLKKLNVSDPAYTGITDRISLNGIEYIDRKVVEQYNQLKEQVDRQNAEWEDDHLNSLTIHYLYTRSLFEVPAKEELQTIIDYYLRQCEKYWLDKGLYEQGLIALALANRQQMATPQKILASLRERALRNDELGMYWKQPNSWFWHQLPIETHALMIEVFGSLDAPIEDINALKIWLLKNKQTNHWPTTTSTAAAVYALLNAGDNWLAESQEVKIRFPGWNKQNYDDKIEAAQASAEAGTGYFQVKWDGSEVDESISRIKVRNPNKGPAWGAAYWQYFEDLDKIDIFEETPLTLKKGLFIERSGDRGPVLEALGANAALHPGDKLVVRLELRVDRAMEYVHMKDTRAAGLEPINILSRYRWQDGLGYYESPGDAATNFFFDYLPAGTYVFEYPLRVTYKGEFSNGITSIQCMYAPEFTSHSQGSRVSIK